MDDAQASARLLESRQSVGMMRIAHREGEGVVGQHRFDPIRQHRHDRFQEGGGGRTGLVGGDRHDRFSAEVVNDREFVVIAGISQRRQQFEASAGGTGLA